MNARQQRELADWFRAEFRRLLRDDGELSSPCITVDNIAAPPAVQGKVTLFGELKYAPPVKMSTPRALLTGDTEASQARRFNHALEMLGARPR
jgi:hypothetical protein